MFFDSLGYYFFLFFAVIGFFLVNERHRKIFLLISSLLFYLIINPLWMLNFALCVFVVFFVSKKTDCTEDYKIKRLFLILGIIFVFLPWIYYKLKIGFVNVASGSLTELYFPIGLSFYSFQSISYLIDVYRKEIEPENDFIIFALYMSFFPKILSGPIERANNLIPQLKSKFEIHICNISNGFRLIGLGLFKKFVIANSLSIYVDMVYKNLSNQSRVAIFFATILFFYRNVLDFSAYTDIARGSSVLFGINLSRNFKNPFIVTSISEMWTRINITLGLWFRDYVFFPLNYFSRKIFFTYVNIVFTFFLLALWHGFNINIICCYTIIGLFIVIENLFKNKSNEKIIHIMQRIPHLIKTAYVLILMFFPMVFLNTDDFTTAITTINSVLGLGSNKLLSSSDYQIFSYDSEMFSIKFLVAIIFVLIGEGSVLLKLKFNSRFEKIKVFLFKSLILKWIFYFLFIIAFLIFGNFKMNPFYYFRF